MLAGALNRRPSTTQCSDQILYTVDVQAHWSETTVGEHGEIVLEGLPFEPGQPVEVLVVSKTVESATAEIPNLRGSVLEYHDPLEPIANDDWDALR